MRYYKTTDKNNNIISIGTGDDGIEITEEEYNALMAEIQTNMAEIQAKWDYINKLADGKITANDVPAEWRTEVVTEAEAIIAAREEAANQPEEITAEEALDILLGGETA